MINKSRKGSVTIETAIVFSITMVFICSIISVVSFFRANILMQRSVEATCEEVSLLMPLAIPAGDSISMMINTIPDGGENAENVMNYTSEIYAVLRSFNVNTGGSIGDFLLENTLSPVMAESIANNYRERNGSDFYLADSIDVYLRADSTYSAIDVTVTYSVRTLAGRIERSIFTVIPVYGQFNLLLSPQEHQQNDYDIWSEDNFTRGDYFREEQGANLPKTFPTIDVYDGYNATSIASIDLTAPRYQSDRRLIENITSRIDELADFDGASTEIHGYTYTVNGNNIGSRTLKVIIPSNSGDRQREIVNSMISYASSRDVALEIEEYGSSRRFATTE